MKTVMNVLVLAIAMLFVMTSAAADWPNWRGPNHDGISTEKDWNPEALKKDVKKIRNVNVGDGYSMVAVKDGKVYTMGNKDEKDSVYCLDEATGKELWKYSYPCGKGSYPGPRSTPTVDGDMVYAVSREGDVFCLKASDGSVVWKKNVIKDYGAENIGWGIACSPRVYGNGLIINAGINGIMLNKKNGEKVWASEAGKGGYSTAVVYQKGDKHCAAIFGQKAMYGVDLKSGKQLWSFPWETSYDVNAADPIVVGDLVFLSSGYGRGCAVIDISGTEAKEVWQNKEMCNQFSSSVYIDGYIYGISGNAGKGDLKCLDMKTGKVKWSHDSGFGALMAADGKLIILNEKGELSIAEATPTAYKELSQAKVLDPKGAKCWNMPVLSNGKIYCRDSKGELVSIDVSK